MAIYSRSRKSLIQHFLLLISVTPALNLFILLKNLLHQSTIQIDLTYSDDIIVSFVSGDHDFFEIPSPSKTLGQLK
jgi:hypothetical protein